MGVEAWAKFTAGSTARSKKFANSLVGKSLRPNSHDDDDDEPFSSSIDNISKDVPTALAR